MAMSTVNVAKRLREVVVEGDPRHVEPDAEFIRRLADWFDSREEATVFAGNLELSADVVCPGKPRAVREFVCSICHEPYSPSDGRCGCG